MRALRAGAMRGTMALGDFLVAYLRKIGVEYLFGIPGDLVLRLFSRLGRPRGLKIVTLSHEPGVGFAADGYARATGRIGVACVTYGAGPRRPADRCGGRARGHDDGLARAAPRLPGDPPRHGRASHPRAPLARRVEWHAR